MPPKRDIEEEKVESAISLLKSNLGMTRREVCYRMLAAYGRVTRRVHGIPFKYAWRAQ